jgi:transcriptional regulator with XRE-family HTH domain/tetratricopeptide (TPR) repeat protein
MRVSQRDFADQLGVTARTVSKWEAGGAEIVPRPDSQAILDTKLRQVTDEVRSRFQLILSGAVEATEIRSEDAEKASPPDNRHFIPTSENERSAGLDNNQSVTNSNTIDGLVVSPTLPSSADISVPTLIEASTADAAQITMSAGREVINPLAIEQLYEEVCRLSVDYIGSTMEANRQILQRATDLRQDLKELIATGYRKPSQTADIYLMIGILSGICAYSCLDFNRPDEAVTQARTSFMMGDLIGHDGLRAWASGTRSLIARFQERYPEALRYAREGIQYATTGTALVRLRCGEGQTLAHMGNAADSIKFLNLAKEAREHVSSPDIASGLFIFSEAKQTYYTGSSLQWLPGEKNAKSAQTESARAIQMFESAGSESRSPGDVLLARIYLGNSRLTLGEIEGSMDALRPVLDLPLSSRSSWQKKRMRQIVTKLDKANFSDSLLAISARDEISSFVKSS